MPKLDSYLFREFAPTTFAALVVLMVVSLGGVFADVLKDIVGGKVPAGIMLTQLGLQLLNYLPLILPLGLMLGLLLGVGRLYRDSEAPVLASIGVGPRRRLVRPRVRVVAACALGRGGGARADSRRMIEAGQRTRRVPGLEGGRFVGRPGGGGVAYATSMSSEGTHLGRVVSYRQDEGR